MPEISSPVIPAVATAPAVSAPCWRCHERVGGPVCVGCSALQPAPPAPDPWALFGLPRRYRLDLDGLEPTYRALARQLHPDRYVGKAPQERQAALQWTAHLNESRRILRDPHRRARMLATGHPEPRDPGPRLPQAFLEEILEWRELDEERPGAARAMAQARALEIQAELDATLDAWEEGRGSLAPVEEQLARLRYVQALAT